MKTYVYLLTWRRGPFTGYRYYGIIHKWYGIGLCQRGGRVDLKCDIHKLEKFVVISHFQILECQQYLSQRQETKYVNHGSFLLNELRYGSVSVQRH